MRDESSSCGAKLPNRATARFRGLPGIFGDVTGKKTGKIAGVADLGLIVSRLTTWASGSGIAANEGEDVRVPGVENAELDPKKIRDYLLSATHPLGRFKASFFRALGYTSSNWDVLASDLRALAERGEAELAGMNDYGQKYLVRGILKGPSGGSATVVTVWIILSGEGVPRFVTAFPGGIE